jgi:hypothetical protein
LFAGQKSTGAYDAHEILVTAHNTEKVFNGGETSQCKPICDNVVFGFGLSAKSGEWY